MASKVGLIVPKDISKLQYTKKEPPKVIIYHHNSTQNIGFKIVSELPETSNNKQKTETKYACECGKHFKRNQSLNSHRNFVCGKVKQRFCRYCKKFFWAHQQLLEHQQKCHGFKN